MVQCIRNLRLEIAQFNTFIIENYLAASTGAQDLNEPYIYLFANFYDLSTGLGKAGSYLGNIESTSARIAASVLLKNLLHNSIITIYLIEKSKNEQELSINIKAVNTFLFNSSINNIKYYGALYKRSEADIEQEVTEFKHDHPDYYDSAGASIYQVMNISLEDATKFLVENTQLLKFKEKFENALQSYQYFIQYNGEGTPPGYKEILMRHVSNSIFLILLAITYIEPFYNKQDSISDEFTRFMTTLLYHQTALINILK